MECYDATTRVYYPHHEPYTGPCPDYAGRCARCREVLDPQLAAYGDAEAARQRREKERQEAEFRRFCMD